MLILWKKIKMKIKKKNREDWNVKKISNENSFQSHGSKNYILKSDFLNTTESQNNISKEENNYSNSNYFN